jgi:hypothetical protein
MRPSKSCRSISNSSAQTTKRLTDEHSKLVKQKLREICDAWGFAYGEADRCASCSTLASPVLLHLFRHRIHTPLVMGLQRARLYNIKGHLVSHGLRIIWSSTPSRHLSAGCTRNRCCLRTESSLINSYVTGILFLHFFHTFQWSIDSPCLCADKASCAARLQPKLPSTFPTSGPIQRVKRTAPNSPASPM